MTVDLDGRLGAREVPAHAGSRVACSFVLVLRRDAPVPTPAAEAFSFALRRRRFRRELVCRYRGTSCVIDSNDVQAHITGFWSTVAADYDAHAGNVAEHGSVEYRRWVDVLASVVPDPPGDVLDVATGTGYVALAAASIGQRVTAIDLAPAMLEELVANATARSLTVDARLGDAVAPDFAPASFDAVTSRHLLWTLREPARAMVNWRQLLRPGGRLVAVDGFWFSEWDDEDVPALFAEHYTTGTRRELPFMHLDGPEPILKLLTAGGFMEVAAEPRPDLGLGNGVPYLITATTR